MDVIKPSTNRPMPAGQQTAHLKPRKRSSWMKKVALVLVAVLVICGAAFGVLYWLVPGGQKIDHGSYQAVYLATGQVYFGELQNVSGEYMVLKSPYTAQKVEQPTDTTKTDEAAITTPPQTTLVKLTDQVYGPQDTIALRSSQVLFWQNLKADSKVQKAIEAKQ